MTISIKPTASGSTIEQDGSTVLSIESDRSVDVDSGTLHVDATNNRVGIGTSSPATTLTVTGSYANGIEIYKNGVDSTSSARLFFNSDTNTTAVYNANGNFIISTGATVGSSSGTERMRINSSGNVLVNTTSAYGVITSYETTFNAVTSSWATNGASLSTVGSFGGGLVMIDGAAGYAFYCADSGKDLYIKGNTVGIALTGGVYLNNYATSWSSASDESVKDIIEPIDNAIEKVTSLRTVIGKYKDEEEGIRHPFLIAQDVEKVLPEAISVMNKGEDNECLGLSYTDTIPLLVAAIKEQQAIIETLTTRIEALEAK